MSSFAQSHSSRTNESSEAKIKSGTQNPKGRVMAARHDGKGACQSSRNQNQQ